MPTPQVFKLLGQRNLLKQVEGIWLWRPGFAWPSRADTATSACGPSANSREEEVRSSTGTLALCVLPEVLAGQAAMAASEAVAGSVAGAPGFRFRSWQLKIPRPASQGQRKDYSWEEGPRRAELTVTKQESLPSDLGGDLMGKAADSKIYRNRVRRCWQTQMLGTSESGSWGSKLQSGAQSYSLPLSA